MASEPLLNRKTNKRKPKTSFVASTNMPILHVGGHNSMKSLIESVESESVMHVLRNGPQKMKQAEQLGFAVARLELKLQDMAKEDMNYRALAAIVVELSLLTDTPFDLVGMLNHDIQTALQEAKLPTSEETQEFLNELEPLFHDFDDEDKMDKHKLTKGSFVHVAMRLEVSGPSDDEVLLKWFEGKPKEFDAEVLGRIDKDSELMKKWRKFPHMGWILQSAKNSWRADKHCWMQWAHTLKKNKTLSHKTIERSPMAWVGLAEAMISACAEHNQLFHPPSVQNRHQYLVGGIYADLIQVVLPNFLAELIRLKAVLNAQALRAQQTQAKIVAAAMSGFIAVSQAAVAHFTRETQSCD